MIFGDHGRAERDKHQKEEANSLDHRHRKQLVSNLYRCVGFKRLDVVFAVVAREIHAGSWDEECDEHSNHELL